METNSPWSNNNFEVDGDIDPHDDTALRFHAPEAFGPCGFEPLRAQLLVKGFFISANAAVALKVRIEEELTGRIAPRQKMKDGTTPASFSVSELGDRSPWDDNMTNILVRLHAKRVSFKEISVSNLSNTKSGRCSVRGSNGLVKDNFPGKGIKACQEHYYKAVREPKWKTLHDKIREEHEEFQRRDFRPD